MQSKTHLLQIVRDHIAGARHEPLDSLSKGVRARVETNGQRATKSFGDESAAELFLAGCSAMGVDPTDAVMVGDDVNSDVLAAQGLGIRGILVRTGKFSEADLLAAPGRPDDVIDSLADLPGLLGLS